MTTPTHSDHNAEMDPKDGSEEPPGRWHPSPSEMEMDVDVDSEDEVDRHLHINHINHDDQDDQDEQHKRTRPVILSETNVGRIIQSDVEASTIRTIGISGTSDSHARTEVGGRKKTWFNRLPFRRQVEPPALAVPLSGAGFELDPHRLPLPTTRSRSRPQSRASTPLPHLLPFHREEDERPESDGEEEDGEEGGKMCRICFTGEDSDSDSDSDDDPNQDQVGEKTQTGAQDKDEQKNRENHQKRKKARDAHPGSGSGPGLGSGLGRLISPCLCRGSMRVSLFLS